jgi:hypothetical protein
MREWCFVSQPAQPLHYDYGEQRFVSFGLLQGRVITVVHTERSNSTRIIFARKVTRYEPKTNFNQLSN